MFECLTGILAGAPIFAALANTDGAPRPIQNAMIVALNVASFRALPDYRADIEQLQAKVKSLPRRDGVDELLLPGERADREAARRTRNGIPLSESFGRSSNPSRRSLASSRCAVRDRGLTR